MPRLLRESPLNGIWEGSGTVTALDAVRAVARTPESLEVVRAEIAEVAHLHPEIGSALARLDAVAKEPDPGHARTLAALIARLLAAAELTRHAPPALADLYCATRLGVGGDRVLGDIPDGYPVREIVDAVTARAD